MSPKQVFSLNVFEVSTPDGGKDHCIEAQFAMGGMNVMYNTSIDQIRQFFVERRERLEHTEEATD